jgi:hypothetical protein
MALYLQVSLKVLALASNSLTIGTVGTAPPFSIKTLAISKYDFSKASHNASCRIPGLIFETVEFVFGDGEGSKGEELDGETSR